MGTGRAYVGGEVCGSPHLPRRPTLELGSLTLTRVIPRMVGRGDATVLWASVTVIRPPSRTCTLKPSTISSHSRLGYVKGSVLKSTRGCFREGPPFSRSLLELSFFFHTFWASHAAANFLSIVICWVKRNFLPNGDPSLKGLTSRNTTGTHHG